MSVEPELPRWAQREAAAGEVRRAGVILSLLVILGGVGAWLIGLSAFYKVMAAVLVGLGAVGVFVCYSAAGALRRGGVEKEPLDEPADGTMPEDDRREQEE